MSVQIIKPEQQAQGAFDAGRIQERKPIGFPQDGGTLSAYSTLFYWAHAWSTPGGHIAEHPHRGFEIMSVVLTGNIEHYDSSGKKWIPLKAGDVQLIKSGSGISHAERILKDSSIFQIWFDPNLNKSLGIPASYADVRSEDFPVFEDAEMKTKLIVGGTKLDMMSELGYIQDITFKVAEKKFPLEADSIYSFFVIEGSMQINGATATKGDYVLVKSETELTLKAISADARIFIIKCPARPSYKTYAEMYS